MFRYIHDSQNPDKIITKSFPMEQGLAGYTAISCHTIFTDKISEDNRYVAEIDDPNFKTGNMPARQLITCPVFAKTDKDEIGNSDGP
jgi:hypothetical protein